MTELTSSAQAMTSVCVGVSVPADALLARMRRTAAEELATHACSGALCISCGETWPCARARQADLALAGW
jgi:hypothetical protein